MFYKWLYFFIPHPFSTSNPLISNINLTPLVLGIARGELTPEEEEVEDVPHEGVLGVIEDCLQFDASERPTMRVVAKRLTEVLKCCQEL